jgi:hypothetical protein
MRNVLNITKRDVKERKMFCWVILITKQGMLVP